MATRQVWHGTKKCAVNGAKIPRHDQVVGATCPFCGNTMGAAVSASGTVTGQVIHGNHKCAVNGAKIPRASSAIGQPCPFCGNTMGAALGSRKAPTLEMQLEKLERLHDDGVITDDELRERRAALIDMDVAAPVPKPESAPAAASRPKLTLADQWKYNRTAVIVAFVGLGLLLVVAWLGSTDIGDGDGGSRGGSITASPSIATRSAMSEVEGTLLGDAWIGAGAYTVHAAAKAYDASEDFTAYAARISAPGADDLCLYWYSGGRNFGDGLTIGDTVTREFSDWGSAASADSPAASMVRASASTPEGRAVIAKVGC